jgi:hypothetical protein
MSWPYSIKPTSAYELHPLPIQPQYERLDLFFKYKRPSEDIYIGSISKHENLLFEGVGEVKQQFNRYFNEKLYLQAADERSDVSIKLFPKMCWLSRSYYNTGFKYPVCIHYNPRIQKNVMHPGSTRNYIINLFHKLNDINCLYYNTSGVQFEFMNQMKKMTRSDFDKCPDLHFNLVMDHCSMIPHINLDRQAVRDNIPQWQVIVKKRLIDPSFKIYINNYIEELAQFTTNDINEAAVKIWIKDPTNEEDIVRSCILAVIGQSYKSDTLTVLAIS